MVAGGHEIVRRAIGGEGECGVERPERPGAGARAPLHSWLPLTPRLRQPGKAGAAAVAAKRRYLAAAMTTTTATATTGGVATTPTRTASTSGVATTC